MTNEELDKELRLSYYKEIGVLNEEHHVYLVQHVLNSKTFVKKILSLYNIDVYKQLTINPIIGMPKIHDFIEKDGKLYVFEEYISGSDLETLLQEKGSFSEKETISYAIMLCDILERIHRFSEPIIHRDIKPSNVMLTDDNRIVLLDLNSAKKAIDGQMQDTTLLGTHGFAAPEQYGFGASSPQTDIYALGILIRHMLGCRLSSDNLTCSRKLKSIIRRCTRLEPNERYTSASELKEALTKCLDKPSRINMPIFIAASCAVLLILALVIFLALRDKNSDSPSADSYDKILVDSSVIEKFSSESDNNSENASDILSDKSVKPKTLTTDEPSLTPSNTEVTVSNEAPTDIPTPTPTPTDIPTSTPTPTKALATASPEPTPTLAPADDGLNLQSPIGTYEGNDREKLVIADTGLAYYYCYDVECTEVECPWILKDDEITITLSMMHCDITAKVNGDFSELIFKTKSLNWNTEVFTKISSNANDYILDPPPSPNSKVTVLKSGEKTFSIDGLSFTIPKQFRANSDQSNSYDYLGLNSRSLNNSYAEKKNYIIFADVDAGYENPINSFSAGIIAAVYALPYSMIETDPMSVAKSIMDNFLEKLQVTYSEEMTIAGRKSYLIYVSGLLNSGYGPLADNINSGYLLLIPDSSGENTIAIQMMQRIGTPNDDEDCFRFIIENIREEM